MTDPSSEDFQEAVAVIGMAGHFPGARNTTEFWRNLRDGVEAVTRFTDAELRAAQSRRDVGAANLPGEDFGYAPQDHVARRVSAAKTALPL